MHNNQTNFRGKLIISRHGDFYETYHKLNTIIINGNNNMLDINHKIHKLIINGNNNNIEINPFGNIIQLTLKGNNNKIISELRKVVYISDFGSENKIIFNENNSQEEEDSSDIEAQPQRYIINYEEDFMENNSEEEEENGYNNSDRDSNIIFDIVNNINLLVERTNILTFSLEQYINNNLINSNIENALNNLLDISFNDKGINNNNDRCIICFENFIENEKIEMTKCFHLFHYLCIKKWIIIKSESPDCPICRRKL